MSVDGEEAGLTGSTYYTNHSLVPQNKVVAILNLEQVGVGEMLGANYLIPIQF
jgi:Zn-dependent M28 family amino/carboxypeptidase